MRNFVRLIILAIIQLIFVNIAFADGLSTPSDQDISLTAAISIAEKELFICTDATKAELDSLEKNINFVLFDESLPLMRAWVITYFRENGGIYTATINALTAECVFAGAEDLGDWYLRFDERYGDFWSIEQSALIDQLYLPPSNPYRAVLLDDNDLSQETALEMAKAMLKGKFYLDDSTLSQYRVAYDLVIGFRLPDIEKVWMIRFFLKSDNDIYYKLYYSTVFSATSGEFHQIGRRISKEEFWEPSEWDVLYDIVTDTSYPLYEIM